MAEVETEQAPLTTDDGPSVAAPYGFTKDRATGTVRPRKRAGRAGLPGPAPEPIPGASPALDELKAAAADREPAQDRAPASTRGKRARGQQDKAPSEPIPPFRAGPIATGMNRLYARAGKIVKAMDKDIGVAIIESTKKASDDDVTVGEAYEEIARTNPRIRAALLKMIEGGAWGQLVWAHVPILMAVMMKDGIRKRLPLQKLINSLMEDDGEEESADGEATGSGGGALGGLLAGMTPADMAQLSAMANQFMGQAAAGAARMNGRPAPVRVPVAGGEQPAGGP